MIIRGLSQVKVKEETKEIKINNIKHSDIKDTHVPKLSPKRGYAWSD